MNRRQRPPSLPKSKLRAWLTCCVAMLVCCLSSAASAHLMVAQHGTLRFTERGAFLVVSLPVSAFTGVDDNADGRLTERELTAHREDITRQVQAGLVLSDEHGPRPLQSVLINAVGAEHQAARDHAAPVGEPQLLVLGRFQLAPEAGAKPGLHTLKSSLFGRDSAAKLELKVSRGKDVQLVVLTPTASEAALLASSWQAFARYLSLGVEHIVTGWDHLLFLLVVLATGWRWREVLLALSCFTAGHAITLGATLMGGLYVSPSIVEPAIAATIVILASCDWIARKQRGAAGATHALERHQSDRPQPGRGARLALVFGCAMVHGLGLASSLGDLGLSSGRQLEALAGFNLGVEFGQVGAALIAAALLLVARRGWGERSVSRLQVATSLLAIGAGSVWFVQRLT